MEENIHACRINELIKAYKTVASREKLEKERKKYPTIKRRQFNISGSSFSSSNVNPNAITSSSLLVSSFHQLDKYGILSPVYKKVTSSNIQPSNDSFNATQTFKSLIEKSITVEDFDQLSSDFFTKNINVNTCKFLITKYI